jgi:hypothetical protein
MKIETKTKYRKPVHYLQYINPMPVQFLFKGFDSDGKVLGGNIHQAMKFTTLGNAREFKERNKLDDFKIVTYVPL